MQKPYGKACDYWSIGVVTFILLSGTPPFYEEDNFALFEQIKACKYDFEVETWENVSNEAKDFVSKILVADPEKRLNCEEMLNHPWMKMDLSSQNLSSTKNKLSKYIQDRKSQAKLKVENDETDMPDG
mmetsp:Transcript_42350/g.64984  ORF Transcript_42350/g.64984 Transcript_42350/m.64984 type:complete len:128 (-) Transcript_42350:34-417(-)